MSEDFIKLGVFIGALQDGSPKEAPAGIEMAAVLDAWEPFLGSEGESLHISGIISGTARFPAGAVIKTTALQQLDPSSHLWWAKTRNALYRLAGPKAEGSPLLRVASATDWSRAYQQAVMAVGLHTLPERLQSAAAEFEKAGLTGAERRQRATMVADYLALQHRDEVESAWRLLGADPRNKEQALVVYRLLVSEPGTADLPVIRRLAEAWAGFVEGGVSDLNGMEQADSEFDHIRYGYIAAASLWPRRFFE